MYSDAASEAEIAVRVRTTLYQWAEGSGLLERLESDFTTAFAWAVTCSSKDASVEQLALATMDLHLWFLYLDDYAGSDYADFYRRLSCMICGDQSEGMADDATTRILGLFSTHIDRLSRIGLPMARYIEERKVALSVYELRNDRRERGWAPGFEELLELRQVTTLFRLWYTLWELLGNFQLSEEEYRSSGFNRAIIATTRWHVLVNDVHSVSRDAESNMPNLVLCLERDCNMSRLDAVASLLARCEELERELEAARAATVGPDSGVSDLRTAFEFLRLNIEGGRALYRRSLARYQASG